MMSISQVNLNASPAHLFQIWQKTCEPFCQNSVVIGNGFTTIAAAYTEPHRHYHTLQHLHSCFDVAKNLVPLEGEARSSFDLAIWFHDFVYDPMGRTNESQSAVEAQRWAEAMDIPLHVVQKSVDSILATTHRLDVDLHSEVECYVLDTDLAILGASKEEFDEYCAGIRQEYKMVPDEVYWPKRLEILNAFAHRPHLYLTKVFKDAMQEKALANLGRETAHCKQEMEKLVQ